MNDEFTSMLIWKMPNWEYLMNSGKHQAMIAVNDVSDSGYPMTKYK